LGPIEDDLLLFLVSHLELLSDVLLPKGIEDDLGRDFRHISLVKRPPLIMDNKGLLINYLTKRAKTGHENHQIRLRFKGPGIADKEFA
jgi:hypothetical protein